MNFSKERMQDDKISCFINNFKSYFGINFLFLKLKKFSNEKIINSTPFSSIF